MAELTTQERAEIATGLARRWSGLQDQLQDVLKTDLVAAVGATDTWVEDSQANYNAALPTAARNGMTTDQKTLLLCAVALKRAGLLGRIFRGGG